ncbi:MAG: hypothetical protein GXP37_15245 [Chloroflexi bacterium]|nr:hypothetical protein [Chloroflexota bacterium]
MIREPQLRELVEFDGQGSSVLSLYLNVDPRQGTIEQYRLALRQLFDTVPNANPKDRARIEHYIDLEYDRQALGLTCFSCQERDFWRAYPLHVPVENAIMIDRRPLVRRLVDLIDAYGYLGVVAVDRSGARFFSFHLGELEEATGALGEEVKRHKQGGPAAARYQRHEDEAARANLRLVAELTERYTRQYDWQRLVLAGTEDNLAQFKELLPTHIQQHIVGTIAFDFGASPAEVRVRAEAVALAATHDYHIRLADNLVVAAAKGTGAVVGLDATLDAVQNGSVYQLLFAESYTIPEGQVRRCTQCNYLNAQAHKTCPVCGAATDALSDALNTIARRAIAASARVIILPAENPLSAAGHHIGAYLRY